MTRQAFVAVNERRLGYALMCVAKPETSGGQINGRKVRLGLPACHVHVDFADEGLGHADIDAVDPGQVDAADAVQLTAQVKLWRMAYPPSGAAWAPSAAPRERAPGTAPRLGRCRPPCPRRSSDAVRAPDRTRRSGAGGVVHGDCLLQHKQEVWLPGALEALGYRVSV